jgi:hypothetical protein
MHSQFWHSVGYCLEPQENGKGHTLIDKQKTKFSDIAKKKSRMGKTISLVPDGKISISDESDPYGEEEEEQCYIGLMVQAPK